MCARLSEGRRATLSIPRELTSLEAISKIGFRFKIKAEPRFEPQAYMEYVEDLKRGSNTDIGLEDIFEMAYRSHLKPESYC